MTAGNLVEEPYGKSQGTVANRNRDDITACFDRLSNHGTRRECDRIAGQETKEKSTMIS